MATRRGGRTDTSWVAMVAMLAFASTAAAAKHRPRVIVLDFPTEQAFQGNANKVLNEFFATDLRQQGFDVLTQADVASALGVEKQRELLGCTDNSCVADIGGALGSEYIARGTIAVLEDITALSISLQDARGAEINRVSARVPSKTASALLAKLDEMVPQLVQPLHDSGKLAVPTEPTIPPPAPTTPPPSSGVAASPGAPPSSGAAPAQTTAPSVAVTSNPSESPSHLPSYVLFGVGAAGLIAGGVGGILYSSDIGPLQKAAAGTTPNLTPTQGATLRGNVNRDEILTTIGLSAGLVAAGAGVVLYLMAPSAPPSASLISPTSTGLAFRF